MGRWWRRWRSVPAWRWLPFECVGAALLLSAQSSSQRKSFPISGGEGHTKKNVRLVMPDTIMNIREGNCQHLLADFVVMGANKQSNISMRLESQIQRWLLPSSVCYWEGGEKLSDAWFKCIPKAQQQHYIKFYSPFIRSTLASQLF